MKKSTRIITILALIALIALPVFAHPVKEEAEAPAPAAAVEAPAPARIVYTEINDEDLVSKFNYCYGYELTYGLVAQEVSLDAKSYARGIIDGFDAYYIEPLVSAVDMDTAVNTYIATFYNLGLTQEPGEVPTMDVIMQMEAPEGIVEAFSYAYGFMYVYQLYYQNGLPIDPMEFLQGAVDAIYQFDPLYDGAQRDQIISDYAAVLDEEYEAYLAELVEGNLQEANDFIDTYKDSPEVINLNDKVLIQIVSEDETLGATPKATDSVVVDYTLILLNGSVVDQGQDVTFNLQSLIPGFTLACTNMKVGQEVYAYIHPDFGYGVNGAGSSIEPNSLLIFDIYLKGIVE